VLDTHAQARLCIVGDGPRLRALKRLACKLDIHGQTDFVGYQKDIYPYLSNSKMLIIASSAEGFPFVLVEAMAVGVIPVTTPVGCIPDFITEGETGLFFTQKNAQELTEKIKLLLEDFELHKLLRENILSNRAHLSMQYCTEVWGEVFARLLGERPQTPGYVESTCET
jgi:glycosyltransferase involved in cell wall biosynthesis